MSLSLAAASHIKAGWTAVHSSSSSSSSGIGGAGSTGGITGAGTGTLARALALATAGTGPGAAARAAGALAHAPAAAAVPSSFAITAAALSQLPPLPPLGALLPLQVPVTHGGAAHLREPGAAPVAAAIGSGAPGVVSVVRRAASGRVSAGFVAAGSDAAGSAMAGRTATAAAAAGAAGGAGGAGWATARSAREQERRSAVLAPLVLAQLQGPGGASEREAAILATYGIQM
jgi:hypothetical protein